MDRDSFADRVRLHQPGLSRFVARHLRSKEDADEIVQDTFLRAWAQIGKFRPILASQLDPNDRALPLHGPLEGCPAPSPCRRPWRGSTSRLPGSSPRAWRISGRPLTGREPLDLPPDSPLDAWAAKADRAMLVHIRKVNEPSMSVRDPHREEPGTSTLSIQGNPASAVQLCPIEILRPELRGGNGLDPPLLHLLVRPCRHADDV